MTLEEAKEYADKNNREKRTNCYMLIKRGDLFYEINQCGIDSPSRGSDPALALQFGDVQHADAPTVSLSKGDQIVIIDDVNYCFWQVDEIEDYVYPSYLNYSLEQSPNEEIDGRAINGDASIVKEVLESKGMHFEEGVSDKCSGYGWLYGPEGATITIGYYDKMEFKEKVYTTNANYYLWEPTHSDALPTMLKPKLEKTKNGYFVIDTSGFAPGVYLGFNNNAFSVPQYVFRVE